MYAKIVNDLLSPPDSAYAEENRDGMVVFKGNAEGELLKFRLLDDDREVYYVGEADDESLEALASWAERDSGCTILQTREGNRWVDTIG